MKFIKNEKTGEIFPANRLVSVRPIRSGVSVIQITEPELGRNAVFYINKEATAIIKELFEDDSFKIITYKMSNNDF